MKRDSNCFSILTPASRSAINFCTCGNDDVSYLNGNETRFEDIKDSNSLNGKDATGYIIQNFAVEACTPLDLQLIILRIQSAVKYILFVRTEFDAHGFSPHVVIG